MTGKHSVIRWSLVAVVAVTGASGATADASAPAGSGTTARSERVDRSNAVDGSATVVRASKDTYVRADRPRAGYGHSRVLRVGVQPRSRGYVTFHVPGVGSGREIGSVTLRVYVVAASAESRLSVASARGAWRAGGLTWTNRPRRGTPVDAASHLAEGSWVTLDVTPLVPLAGDAVLTLRLGGDTVRLRSSDARRHRPGLVVSSRPVRPEPRSTPSELLARRDLIYGSEIGAWQEDGGPAVDPHSVVPSLVRGAGIPVVRFALHDVFRDQRDPAGNPGTQSRKDFVAALDGIRSTLHAEPFVKLLPIAREPIYRKRGDLYCPPRNHLARNLPSYKSVVKTAGRRVVLYESSNEMEYDCYRAWGFRNPGVRGVSTLLGRHFAQNMPALKKYARSLGFEILTVGYAGVSGGFGWGDTVGKPRIRSVHEFLVATHDAYLAAGRDPDYVPDVLSLHAYPNGGDFGYAAEQRDIIAYWDNLTAAIREDIRSVWGSAGAHMRLAVSEWNAGDKDWPGFHDRRVNRFYAAWLHMLRRNGYWLANQFALASNDHEPYDLVRSDGRTRRQYRTFRAVSLGDPLR